MEPEPDDYRTRLAGSDQVTMILPSSQTQMTRVGGKGAGGAKLPQK